MRFTSIFLVVMVLLEISVSRLSVMQITPICMSMSHMMITLLEERMKM